MSNPWVERKEPDSAEVRRNAEALRGIFGPGLATAPDIEQIAHDVRPQVREVLQREYGAGDGAANAVSGMVERDQRTEHWRGGNVLFSPIPLLSRRGPRKAENEVVGDSHLDAQMHWFMNQQNVRNLLDDPADPDIRRDIRNLLERRLGAEVLENLENYPEIRYGIALAFAQGGGVPANVLAFLNEAIGDAGRVGGFTGLHTARRSYEDAKGCLDNVEKAPANVSTAVNEFTVSGDPIERWDQINVDLNALRVRTYPTGTLPSVPTNDAKRVEVLEKEIKELQAKKQKLQMECTKILETANLVVANYGAAVDPTLLGEITTLRNGLGPITPPLAVGAVVPPNGVDWSGNTTESRETISRCIAFVGGNDFINALHALRPHLEHIVSNRKREADRAKGALTVSQDGLDDKLSSSDFLYKLWFEIYRQQAVTAAGGGVAAPVLDRALLRKNALMSALSSASDARDEDLLRIKNEIRCEELARRSSLWRRLASRHNFSPSAKEVLRRLRHVSIAKEGKNVKPFAKLDLHKNMSRAELRKAIKEGKLSQEDVPRLYLHLEAILKNHREHTIRPKDAGYIIELIQNLRVIRNEMLHQELLAQFRTSGDTPEGNILKLLRAKMEHEKSWERQMADDILRGEFWKTVSPRAIRKEKRALLKDIKQKMLSGQMGYGDAVKLLEENGFEPGVLKKAHLVGRKFANFFRRREKSDEPGLVRKTAGGLWKAGTFIPRKVGGVLGKGAKKVLGVPLGIFETLTGMFVVNPLKWVRNIFNGSSGSVGRVRNKYRWFSNPAAA